MSRGVMDLRLLQLDVGQLSEVAQLLEARIEEGLAADLREIRALPAYLAPPSADLEGEAVVVDAGGTNVRAAHVRVGERLEILGGPESEELPVRGAAGALNAEGFWQLQAKLARQTGAPGGLPLGYCFSYPSSVHEDGDATLLGWTKGVDISGVEGERVGRPLAEAMGAAGVSVRSKVVLNDTVATLLGASLKAEDPSRTIGLIAGTGTNMAAYYAPKAGRKLPAGGPMAVNLESGNFVPPHLSPVDEAFDAEGGSPGRQRFEKAVSGYALPYLFSRLVPEAGLDPAAGTGPMGELRRSGSGRAQAAAAALLDRSADLVAAGLYGVARSLGGSAPITVLAEGSLIWKADGYADRVRARLAELAGRHGPRFELKGQADVNLYGSAAAALSWSHGQP